MCNKQLSDSVFVISKITAEGLGKVYMYQPEPHPSATADNPHLDLDYSGYRNNLIQ